MKKLILIVFVVLMVVTALEAGAAYKFDMDSDFFRTQNQDLGHTGNFYTQPGYTSVKIGTLYTPSLGYGWSAALEGRDRGAIPSDPLSHLLRDLHFSSTDRTFSIDLPNGTYPVILHFRDNFYPHDNLEVYAENISLPVVSSFDVSTNTTYVKNFNVAVTDGQLNLRFHDASGSDPNWIINSIQVVPLPGAVLLLGAGLVRLVAHGRRKLHNTN